MKKIYKKVIKAAKLLTIESQIQQNPGNGKAMWNIINEYTNKAKAKDGPPKRLRDENGEILTKTSQIAKSCNDFFTGIWITRF